MKNILKASGIVFGYIGLAIAVYFIASLLPTWIELSIFVISLTFVIWFLSIDLKAKEKEKIQIPSDAKCKDCKYFKRYDILRGDGTILQRSSLVCKKQQYTFAGEKTEACKYFTPFMEE